MKATTTRCLSVSSSSKKPTNERSPDRRSDANLSRGLYRPLERRESGNEPVLPRIHNRKRRFNVVDEDVRAYGDRHFERMHET